MPLYRDDYKNFVQDLEHKGSRVLITADYRPYFSDESRYELRLQSVEHLANLLEKRTKGLALYLKYEGVTSGNGKSVTYLIE